ncbi:MAG: hypothetical protein JO118_00105 [Acetobacteraceae bacterium]|nr:hypothetical protein [Acetobacteraceae bacterium]
MLLHRLRGRARGLALVAGWVSLAFGLYVVITTCAGIVLNYSPVPFGDQWDGYLGKYIQLRLDFWDALWAPLNEHRQVLARLVFFSDVRWFGGIDLLSISVNLALCSLLVALILLILYQNLEGNAAIRLFLTGAVAAFGFSWIQWENFRRGFQIPFFAVCLFALLSFHAMVLCKQRRHSLAWLGVSIASGLGAVLSMANGLLILPLASLLAVLLRLPWRHVLVTAAIGAAAWLAYFHHAPGAQGPLSQESPLSSALRDPRHSLEFALLYLGSPIAGVAGDITKTAWWPLAAACGLLTVLGTLAGLAAMLVRGEQVRAPQFWMMAVTACGSAAITAGGRLSIGGLPGALISRYTTQALLAWIGLLLFLLVNSPRTRRALPLLLCGLAMIGIGVAQSDALRPNRTVDLIERTAALALRNAVYDERYVAPLYPIPAHLIDIARQARRQGIGMFGRGVPGFDDPPPRPQVDGTCPGHVDALRPTATPGKLVLEGWAWDAARRDLPKGIVVVDGAGRTLGTGIFGRSRQDVQAALRIGERRTGWIAFADAAPEPIRVLAKTAPGRYCAIGEASAGLAK